MYGDNNEFGKYIAELRLSYGYSQYDLAKILGIGRQAYSHYETGRTIPAYRSIVRLAELYGRSTETFINRMHLNRKQWDELRACYKIMLEHDKCGKISAGSELKPIS